MLAKVRRLRARFPAMTGSNSPPEPSGLA